jgi:hypothetical protein
MYTLEILPHDPWNPEAVKVAICVSSNPALLPEGEIVYLIKSDDSALGIMRTEEGFECTQSYRVARFLPVLRGSSGKIRIYEI